LGVPQLGELLLQDEYEKTFWAATELPLKTSPTLSQNAEIILPIFAKDIQAEMA